MCGSGTSIVAASDLRRKYIGFDISEEYCELANKRLEKHKAQTDNDLFYSNRII